MTPLRGSLEHRGYDLGPRVLGDDEVAALAAEAHAMVMDPANPVYPDVHRGETQPFLHVPNVQRVSPAVAALTCHAPLLEVVRDALGPVQGIQLFECHLFVKPPHEDRVRAWHQDTAYLPFARPYRSVGVWLALDDADESNGAMVMVPGSHRMGPLPASLGLDLSDAALRAAGCEVGGEVRAVPSGRVHVHDPAVWHGSPGNRSDRPRAAISMFFVEAGTRFDASGEFARFFQGRHGEPLDPALYPLCG